MMTRFTAGILFLLAAVIPAAVLAQPGPAPRADRPMMMHQRIMEELNLTDQQKKDIDKIHSDAQKDQIDRFAEIAKARVELRDLLTADNPNQTAIEKKMSEITQLRSQATAKRLNTWFAINKLLTPDQQKTWKKTLEQHAGFGGMGMRGRMGMRGGRMNGMRPMAQPMWQNSPGED